MSAPRGNFFRRGVMVAAALVVFGARPVSAAELLIERTIMPEAAPSSFAIGFPNGVSMCYDPVRGGVDYAWAGGFVDIAPVRPDMGKLIKPVTLRGPVLYREQGAAPLRRGDPTRKPVVVFKGYRLHGEAIEFLYTVDGLAVREEVRARPQGDGLIRRFRIEATADSRWWYLPGQTEGAVVKAATGEMEAGGFRFDPAAARDFTLEIVFQKKQP